MISLHRLTRCLFRWRHVPLPAPLAAKKAECDFWYARATDSYKAAAEAYQRGNYAEGQRLQAQAHTNRGRMERSHSDFIATAGRL